jgi:hypothetical protein
VIGQGITLSALSDQRPSPALSLLAKLQHLEDVMETREQIETDLIKLMARLIDQHNGDGPPRGISKELKCSRPELGRWISGFDFSFLIETLLLGDHLFVEEFPGLRLTAEHRKQFASTLEAHCKECDRCQAKSINDRAWQECTDRIFADNKEVIGKVLAKAASKA